MEQPPLNQNPNDPEFQLFQQYQRRQRRQKILLSLVIGIPLLLSAVILVPGFLKKQKDPRDAENKESKEETTKSVASSGGKDHAGSKDKSNSGVTSAPGQEVVEFTSTPQIVDDGKTLAITEETQERIDKTEAELAAAEAKANEVAVDPLEALRPQADGGAEPDPDAPRMVALTFPGRQHQSRSRELDQLTAAYSSAKTIEERLPYVINGKGVIPLMREFYGRPANELEEIGPLLDRQFFLMQGVTEYAIQTHRTDVVGSPRQYVGLKRTPEGYRLDWESLVGYSEKTWGALRAERPKVPILVRCFSAPDSYYNYEYSDSGKWQCYRLEDVRDSERLYGYTPRGSEIDLALQAASRKRGGANPAPVILRIRYPEDSKSKRCVDIEEFVQETWLMLKP